MILPQKISAVVFDLDGTLHDTEIVYVNAFKESIAAMGVEADDAFCHSLIGLPRAECDALLRGFTGPDFPFAEWERRNEAARVALLADGVRLKPGALELLDELAARRLPVAIATSASRVAADRNLARSGLDRRIPVIVTRDDVLHGKPAPDPFLKAAALLGIAPGSCLAIEDSFNGIRSAHAAGMMAVMVPDVLTPTAEIRGLCVRVAVDLHEVLAMVVDG